MARNKPIAIALSDIHFHLWKQYNQDNARFWSHLAALSASVERANRYDVPVLISGDFINSDTSISNELFELITLHIFPIIKSCKRGVIAISGNHDMSQQNTLTNFSPSWVRSFSRIINDWKFMCIDRTFVDSNHNIRVFGLPYLNHNLGVHEILQSLVSNIDNTKTNILLTHMDLPGLMDTDGREVNTFESPDIKEETLYELFGKFDLVLNGHIHLPQKKEPNILTIGAPLQMRKSDSDAELGYWVIYREHQEFKELNLPKFKFFKKGETPWTETGEEQHYWIEVNPGAIISDHKSPIITFDNRTKLAKNYCKLKGVDSKRKLNKLIKVLNDEGNI